MRSGRLPPAWFTDEHTRLPMVSAARAAVYEAGGRALTLAQEAVGVQALFVDHPLSATITDLSDVICASRDPTRNGCAWGARLPVASFGPCFVKVRLGNAPLPLGDRGRIRTMRQSAPTD